MYIILDKRGTMELPIQTRSEKAADAALAIVLEGVSAKWDGCGYFGTTANHL